METQLAKQFKAFMEVNQFPGLTLKEALENYNDVVLTEDEVDFCLLKAKIHKKIMMDTVAREKQLAEKRRFLTQKTNYDLVKGLMLMRAKSKFDPEFVLDDANNFYFELLCRYFGNDPQFVSLAEAAGIQNASLEKGLFFVGNFGVGKTMMFELFRLNQRQCYKIISAKEIADDYWRWDRKDDKESDPLTKYIIQTKNAFEDSSLFCQPYLGLCIDDLGTEDVKNNFGNKKNVIGDILEIRSNEMIYGPCLHASSNLTADQLEAYYGGRVKSRMRKMFNFIEFKGLDRRK